MRKGSNPEKLNNKITNTVYHRIVIPVFIPNLEGYFSDAFTIFKLCIQSLLLTIHSKTKVTIYNNASHSSVKEYLDNLYKKENQIDQVFHSKENVGKINAILASVKGNLEPLITISDADVLFKQNWQFEVEDVFNNFKSAGMVGPVPFSKAFNSFTSANWFYGFFKGKLKFKKVQNPKEMKMFEDSLGIDFRMLEQAHLENYLTIQNNNFEAVMGCGHFVATLRREVFDLGPNEPAFFKIIGGTENKFIDKPNEDLGFLRLATIKNNAFHMGNEIEDWMYDEFKKLKKISTKPHFKVDEKYQNISKFNVLIGKIISRLLKKKHLKKIVFKYFFKMNEDY